MFTIWNSRAVITFIRSSNTSIVSGSTRRSYSTNILNKRFMSQQQSNHGAATQNRKFS